MTEGAAIYVEMRYHYIPGPEFTDPSTGNKRKGTGHFLPITVGLRF